MTTAPNNIIDEKDALRVVAQMTIGEIVRGIAALSKSAPVAESPASDGTGEWPRVFVDEMGSEINRGDIHVHHSETDVALFGADGRLWGPLYWWSLADSIRKCSELTGPAKLAKLKELGCDERGVYVGKQEKREWPKLVGSKKGETYGVVWVYRSERDGEFWNSNSFIAADGTLFSRLADPENAVLDTPEARAFIAKRYDEQGNLRAEYRKGETPKVRVFEADQYEYAEVWRTSTDGDFLHRGRFSRRADGNTESTVHHPAWRELPPAEVPQWLSDHGYLSDGTRKQETPATPIDPDAGRKYGEAVARLVKLAKEPTRDSYDQHDTWIVNLRWAAQDVEKLDAAQGGVR